MFRQILAPVDLSPVSGYGLRWAGALARRTAANLVVLHARPFTPPVSFTSGRFAELQTRIAGELPELEAEVRAFTAEALGAIEPWVTVRVVEALPADAIIAAAGTSHADLIVMGTHGRSGLDRLFLGSVTERVLRQSCVPVLTVRAEAQRGLDVRNILCPVNDSAVAVVALALANELAEVTGARVTVVYVEEPGGEPAPMGAQVIRKGNAAQEIVAAAAEMQCDVLVIGARRRRFSDTTVIGTTSAAVVRQAPCPVMTVLLQTREAEA